MMAFLVNILVKTTLRDDTQLAQLKSAEEDKMDETDIHDEVQLCVRDWVEEEALTIYKQH